MDARMTILLFEDSLVTALYPATVARPAFLISCGSRRLMDQMTRLGPPVRAAARPHLREILRADFPHLLASPPDPETATLLVNARLVPSVATREELARLIREDRPGVVRDGDSVAAALVPAGAPDLPRNLHAESWNTFIEGLQLEPLDARLPLIQYPHDIVRHHLAILSENLEERIARGGYQEIADGVFAAPDAKLGNYIVSDTSRGPILLETGASIGPYCYFRGPAYLGAGARVIEHSAIKDCVAIGRVTKIGGEVEASVVESYSNKQHHGFLGHSYLGSWINLGAGTCNSDLKNTYGQVNMIYDGKKVATDMQFVGAIVGDYAKTAINTGIFTGKTIGVCSMIYGFVTTNVPSFVNYARLFGQVTAAPPEVMIAAQARMFARRNVAQRPCDIQLIRDMHQLTRHERELGSVPPEPLSF
jgi:glucose-1-phosphate thymidylyltransferase